MLLVVILYQCVNVGDGLSVKSPIMLILHLAYLPSRNSQNRNCQNLTVSCHRVLYITNIDEQRLKIHGTFRIHIFKSKKNLFSLLPRHFSERRILKVVVREESIRGSSARRIEIVGKTSESQVEFCILKFKPKFFLSLLSNFASWNLKQSFLLNIFIHFTLFIVKGRILHPKIKKQSGCCILVLFSWQAFISPLVIEAGFL
jgi:hypothetical protein